MEEETLMTTYIENPLPVPKKHISRELGYGFEPQGKEMRFDLETDAKDDYDHQ